MQYLNEVRLVGELMEAPTEKMVSQSYVIFFRLKTDTEIHYVIAKDEVARLVHVAMREGKIFYVVGHLSTVKTEHTCHHCSRHQDNRLTRIIASEIVCLGDASHYTSKFLTIKS